METLSSPPEFIICTADQTRMIDKKTIEEFGIPGFTLMEVAGYSAAVRLTGLLPEKQRGVYFCGKGNNAGDALVVARYLVQRQHEAAVVFVSGTSDLSPDCQKNYELLGKLSENDNKLPEIEIYESLEQFDRSGKYDFVVDGMLGTGLDSDLRGDYTDAVDWINSTGLPVFSIDIPTGLHSDSGMKMGKCVRATRTFTFGALKQGFYLNEGYRYTGKIDYCPLPFPDYLKKPNQTYLISRSWLREEEREPARHKYAGGVLYIVAGSEGLTGAAVLAAESAWAEGLGAVILVTPRGNLDIFEKNLPQIIKKPVGSRDDFFFKKEHVEEVLEILNEKDGKVLFGPGLGRDASTEQFASEILEFHSGDMIIDADGLWALSRIENWRKPKDTRWILTPHPGELSRLTDRELDNDLDRLHLVKEFSAGHDIFLVSKGFPVITGTPDGRIFMTGYDTRTFSRAGFGDVLAGKIGAYWSLGHEPARSAALALLNGKDKAEIIKHEPGKHPEPKDLI